MERFAVIDTETTWGDDVMSIGIVAAEFGSFEPIGQRYYILTPYKDHGGMYTYALYAGNTIPDMECPRRDALADAAVFLKKCGVSAIFAYNAYFDYGHLPELSAFKWFDIMKIAAYKQYNQKIPENADCFKTGRLKRGYGVESIYRILSDDKSYRELHNALTDAVDELAIMRMLGLGFGGYVTAKIGG